MSGWKWILITKRSVQENLEAPGEPWPPPRPLLDGDLYTHTRLRACSRQLCKNDRENSPVPILPAHGRATGGELSHAGCTLALECGLLTVTRNTLAFSAVGPWACPDSLRSPRRCPQGVEISERMRGGQREGQIPSPHSEGEQKIQEKINT